MGKYNIYIICKNEEIFNNKKKEINNKYRSRICHIEWIPAEYLQLTQCNQKLLKDLNTRYNTQKKKILAKLGCIAAHRKALLAIYSSKTNNNIVLEEDSVFASKLPVPPKESCYMGGWIVPPQITKAGKVIPDVKPIPGINKIEYDKFKMLMTHALFIKTHEEALKLFHTTIADKIKNYDVHLNDVKLINKFFFPPIFVQDDHVSEIEGLRNNNDQFSTFYGLGGKKTKKTKRTKKTRKRSSKIKSSKSKIRSSKSKKKRKSTRKSKNTKAFF
tara:strand:+ start:1796 stop:2614 length:819 start_codon:yes stop_codon:yes gene_type:complete